jgi:hypothetical protein
VILQFAAIMALQAAVAAPAAAWLGYLAYWWLG